MQTAIYSNKVINRDGFEENFDRQKIYESVLRAGKASGEFNEATAKNLTNKIERLLKQRILNRYLTVNEIQETIENLLIDFNYKESLKIFITKRVQHDSLKEIIKTFDVDLMERYLEKRDWQIAENSNITFSLQGLYHYLTAEACKMYWLKKIYPTEISAAHIDGDFHIHTLGFLGTYCVGWDLQDLLNLGFQGSSGKFESKPAKHFRSALGQITNFFYTLQGESAGAQAFSNFDTLLAPFIKHDHLTYLEVKQALQEFLFNMNIPTRIGFQPPFTNLTMDVKVPDYLADQPVVIGGEKMRPTYKEFQNEMDILNKAFWEVMLEGDAKGREFTFPIPTYNITKDFDWDNPSLAGLWAVTAKYGTPYFANFINSDMKPEDARSMCCRLRIDNRELRKRGGGFFASAPLTGSIGVVTINMPRIGLLSVNEEEFLTRLGILMDRAKESLEIKRKVLEKFTEDGLYPYMKFYLGYIKKRFGEYWRNHFSTIGLLGMNEACLNLFNEDIASNRGQVFSLKVLDFMRQKLIQYQEETNNNYNLEATPAEGATYRLAQIDKQKYRQIICANDKEFRSGHAPFYTNSTHLPVNYSEDIFEVLDLQDKLQSRYTGGTVLHVFIGERIIRTEGLKSLIRMVCTKYQIPYFTITPTFSICPSCGYYYSGKETNCFRCGSVCEIFSRVVGYLRPVQQWNEGKQEEFKKRKAYKICELEG